MFDWLWSYNTVPLHCLVHYEFLLSIINNNCSCIQAENIDMTQMGPIKTIMLELLTDLSVISPHIKHSCLPALNRYCGWNLWVTGKFILQKTNIVCNCCPSLFLLSSIYGQFHANQAFRFATYSTDRSDVNIWCEEL